MTRGGEGSVEEEVGVGWERRECWGRGGRTPADLVAEVVHVAVAAAEQFAPLDHGGLESRVLNKQLS